MHSKDLLDVIFLLGTLQMKKKQYMRGKALVGFFCFCLFFSPQQAITVYHKCTGFSNIHTVITHLSIALVYLIGR